MNMSYVKDRTGRYLPAALALGGVGDLLGQVAQAANDPCLVEVTRQTMRLHDLVGSTSSSAPSVPGPPQRGIGLCSAVKPLRAAIYIAERPWIIPLGITVVFAALVGVGAQIGRR